MGAIDEVRRIAFFAPKTLLPSTGGNSSSGKLREVVECIIALAESLRSAIAKNALRCLAELYLSYGSRLDSELEAALTSCLRRAADTNSFISDEAQQSLREICGTATESRLLVQLFRLAS